MRDSGQMLYMKLLILLSLPHKALTYCVADLEGACSGTYMKFQCLSGINCKDGSSRSEAINVDNWAELRKSPLSESFTGEKNSMVRPRLATADLNGDGLLDIVVTSQLGGLNWKTFRTTYEIALFINTGTFASPYFSMVPVNGSSSSGTDPFMEIRDAQGNCGCDGGKCCSDFFRKDGFTGTSSCGSESNDCPNKDADPWANTFHGLMRGLPVQLETLTGDDQLYDLVLGRTLYKNIGSEKWPRYSELDKQMLPQVTNSVEKSIATTYSFYDVDGDGDLDAFVHLNGLGQGLIHYFENTGNTASPYFEKVHQDISSPLLDVTMSSWGGNIVLADFDADGRVDVLANGRNLFQNRGSTWPQFLDLGMGHELFDGSPIERDSLNSVYLAPAYNMTAASQGQLSLLWVKNPSNNGAEPELQHTRLQVSRRPEIDYPVKTFTPWTHKAGFSENDKEAKSENLKIKGSWNGEPLSNAADMNGDGLLDFITGSGMIFIQTGNKQLNEPAFASWKQLPVHVWNKDVEPIQGAECAFSHTQEFVYSAGDVNNDGLPDLFIGGSNMFTDSVEGAQCSLQFRLVFMLNIGTHKSPSYKRIYHGEEGYPLPDVVFKTDTNHRTTNPCMGGDVNGDGYADLVVSQADIEFKFWAFRRARLFINNKDGTFTEDQFKAPWNKRMLPTNRELYESNLGSKYQLAPNWFVPLQVVDLNGDGYAELFFAPGWKRMEGAVFLNKGMDREGKWIGFPTEKSSDSSVLGDGPDAYPIGHVFFDMKNDIAWRLRPPPGGNRPIIFMYTSIPRCLLAFPTGVKDACAGKGTCSIPVSGHPFAYECKCPYTYRGLDKQELNRRPHDKYCGTCSTGAINVNPTLGICIACPTGYWSNATFAANDPISRDVKGTCRSCGYGRFSPVDMADSESSCIECPPGRYMNSTEYASHLSTCLVCDRGKFSTAGSFSCTPCEAGKFQPDEGQPYCLDCVVGRYQDEVGMQSCKVCQAGRSMNTSGATNACKECQAGYYQDSEGQSLCLKCFPGRFAPSIESLACKLCRKGFFQPDSAAVMCFPLPNGTIATSGFTSFITMPPGQVITKCETGNASCTPFKACPAGKIGTVDHKSCMDCMPGMASLPGSEVCFNCAKGKYNDGIELGTPCKACPVGQFQDQEAVPSLHCKLCPAGWQNQASGAHICISNGYLSAADCTDGMYLDDTNTSFPEVWRCKVCPQGAFCMGDVTWKDVKAKFGWARCTRKKDQENTTLAPFIPDLFERCSFPAACTGAPNPALEQGFIFAEEINRNESCSRGYEGVLCGSCSEGYSHTGDLFGKCSKCPSMQANLTATAAAALAGLVSLVLYLWITISQSGQRDNSDALKMIVLNFLQMLFLVSTFPIEWPDMFVSIFQIGGAVTSLGQHFSSAEVFYMYALLWAIFPVLLVVVLSIFWLIVGVVMAREKSFIGILNSVVGFLGHLHISSVALLYLLYPTLCYSAFSIFACRSICNDGNLYLKFDLQEQCFSPGGRHNTFAYTIGLPMLVVYVLGLPLLAFSMMWKMRKAALNFQGISSAVLSTPKGENLRKHPHFKVYGIFFSMFREGTYYWEISVCFRKAMLAAIGVFGSNLGDLQVHLSSMLLLFVIMMTALVQPFKNERGLGNTLQTLELASLMAVWLTLWSGTIFLSYPKCVGKMSVYDQAGSGPDAANFAGHTMPWCEALAITFGFFNIAVFMSILFVMLYDLKNSKLKNCISKFRGKYEGPESNHSKNTHQQRTGDRTIENENSNRSVRGEEFDRLTTDGLPSARSVEMMSFHDANPLMKTPHPEARFFTQYETEDGMPYFVEQGTQVSLWELPENGVQIGSN